MSTRIGRFLFRIFPSEFRERFGGEMMDFLRTGAEETQAQKGFLGQIRFWIKALTDMARTAVAERLEERKMQIHTGGTSGFSDLRLDARYAVRALLRTPGFTVVALLTLALGIGATTAMFSVANEALGRALPYPEPDRLVMGRATFDGNVNPWVAFPDYMDYRDRAESLESLATISGGASSVTITGGDEPVLARLTFITPNLFETLGTPPVLGRTFTIEELPGEGAGQVVISHGFWQGWFGGDPDVIGKSVIVDGSPTTVMGVMPPGFRFRYDVDIWAPPWPGNSNPITRRYHNWLLVGRLTPEASLESAQAEVDVISAQLEDAYPDSNRRKALQLDGLQEATVEGYRQSLFILLGAIVMVLLIACSNVASLLMARGTTRGGEMALRAALGAGRVRLTRQLLVECSILALVAGGIGVLLAVWLQDLILGFVAMNTLGIQDVGLSPAMLVIALVLSLGTVLIFGLFPSISTGRANPAADLRDGARGSASKGGIRIRSGLVVLQVALSLVLLVGSGLLLKSFARLRGVDPGFRVENVFTTTVSLPDGAYPTPEEQLQFFDGLRETIDGLPGVESVAMVTHLPIIQTGGNVAIWAPERPPETNNDAPWADRRIILPGYFEAMDIPILEGRAFDRTDAAESPPVIMLSRSTAEVTFPDERAVGRQVAVDIGGDEPGLFEVVGVVENHQTSSLAGTPRPAMFFPLAQMRTRTLRLAVALAGGTDPLSLFRPIQERVWERNEDIVLTGVQTYEDAVADSIAASRSMATVMAMFAFVAIALAALGLYGVLAYFVTRRVHEIGIRVALGASGKKVLGLVIGRGMILVGTGSVVGILGALGAARLVEGMLFQIDATDPGTYILVTAFFLVLALAACIIPARRALKVDPVEAFRAE